MKRRRWNISASTFSYRRVDKGKSRLTNTVTSKNLLTIFFLILTHTLTTSAQAIGYFSVTPVRIYMAPQDRAVALTLENQGDTPIALQADLNNWSQKADGTDELVPTDDLILSPPIIKLAPKARQVVRLILLKPFEGARESTYRLIVRELPEVTEPKSNSLDMPIALALSLPVFITPSGAKREVSCVAKGVQSSSQAPPLSSKDKQVFQVECVNTGTAYAQIREVRLQSNKQKIAHLSGGIYLLPGAKKVLPLELVLPVPKGDAELNVTFDDGKNQIYPVTLF